MCKVLMIAGIKPEHQDKVKKILEVASKTLTKVDDDGIGYAGITSQGKIYGEKWLNKDMAFKIHTEPKREWSEFYIDQLLDVAAKWKNKTPDMPVYGRFGTFSPENFKDTVAIMLHARKSTVGSKSIENTHPFVEIDQEKSEDTAIIHNGSITNHAALTKKYSTCDSEVILHEYVKNMMNYNPWSIEEMAKTLKGEYTVGVLSSMIDKDGVTPILDIFKHNKDLFVGYCPEIETAIFSTWEMHLDEIARETGFPIKNIVEVKDGYLVRLNAITGERTEDLVEFTGGAREVYPHTGGGRITNSHHHPPKETGHFSAYPTTDNTTTEDDIEETLEDVKTQFESNHSDLFTVKYQTPGGPSESESQFLAALAIADTTNLRALKLVQRVLGVKVGV